MSASSTPVYVASAGATAAAASPAARPTGGSEPAEQPSTPCRGSSGASSATAATPAAGPNAARIQVPTDIGEVGLATRSMWWKRAGRPRSLTRKYALAPTAPSAASRPARRSARPPGQVGRRRPAARTPAASPPVNRYAGMSYCHTGAFRIGRP